MSQVASLISDMVRQGIDPDIIGRVAEALSERAPAIDVQADRRRAKDRERKRRGIPQNSAESAEQRIPPKPPKKTNLSPPLKGGISPQISDPPPRKADDVGEAFDLWNVQAKSIGLAPAKDLTPNRRAALRRRLAESGLDGWREALAAVRASAFLRGQRAGRDGRIFRADLDFVLQPKSYQRLVEGFYGSDAEADSGHDPPEPVDPWRQRMIGWEVNRYWNSEWGPKPGKPGCLAPESQAEIAA